MKANTNKNLKNYLVKSERTFKMSEQEKDFKDEYLKELLGNKEKGK